MSSSYLPIIISLLSLSLTVVTLYLAQLRSANISVLIGPEIQAYHADYPHISTAMYIPMTFVNTSPNMGTIYKSAVSLYKDDSPDQQYFMLWREFSKIGDNGNWTYDTHAHSFGIQGKSSISKTAWFVWFYDSNPKLFFKQGSYTLLVHVWTGKKLKPLNFKFKFSIEKQDEQTFEARIKEQSPTSFRILLNKDLERNKILTQKESNTLFHSLK